MNDRSALPVTVYGSSISYFTGKVETYFRVKGIPYRFEPMKTRSVAPIVKRETGSTQVPALQLAAVAEPTGQKVPTGHVSQSSALVIVMPTSIVVPPGHGSGAAEPSSQ